MPTVLVTGASTGIGRATALALAPTHTVLAGVRRLEDAPPGTTPVQLDVTNREQVAALRALPRLDALVNNAGIAVTSPLEHLPLDELRRQLEVNVIGQLAITQAVFAQLRAARGRVVNVSSIGGRMALPLYGPYAASKYALEALSDSLRREQREVKVILIEPGAIATPIWDRGIATADSLWAGMPPDAHARYGALVTGMRAQARKLGTEGVPAETAAALIVRALHARRPRARYVIGREARVQAALARVLPDRALDAVLAAGVRRLLNNH
ncbi:SDR family NAD(P)-dependent oxidoreductase [Candidatus Solirubrobacter pratensis]|uniref:SDR family NAD(P)-dependent oxidoreductase n=1 Tax=Candidatus Solirubrobacter pratensis TaxID=1298857 RepID=UPI0004065640|nr:SDR family NAD(P)-dependent oxidoreductase [Candidatus Solirubrobacter pratensis]